MLQKHYEYQSLKFSQHLPPELLSWLGLRGTCLVLADTLRWTRLFDGCPLACGELFDILPVNDIALPEREDEASFNWNINPY